MQFITSLFGGSGNTILTMLFALGAVIVLILLAVWLLRFVFNVSGNATRGRNRRLSVVDTLALDQKRQLVIIRRDNVEHLILTGGPQDMLIEGGIAVEEVVPAVPQGRRPVPTVPARKVEPKPVVTTTPEPVAVAPQPPKLKAGPGTLLEQLQKQGYSGDQKTRVSLRQTGLLRPANGESMQSGHNTDISAVAPADSDNQSHQSGTAEGATFDHDGNQTNRN